MAEFSQWNWSCWIGVLKHSCKGPYPAEKSPFAFHHSPSFSWYEVLVTRTQYPCLAQRISYSWPTFSCSVCSWLLGSSSFPCGSPVFYLAPSYFPGAFFENTSFFSPSLLAHSMPAWEALALHCSEITGPGSPCFPWPSAYCINWKKEQTQGVLHFMLGIFPYFGINYKISPEKRHISCISWQMRKWSQGESVNSPASFMCLFTQ
jgi:hypothetical protein